MITNISTANVNTNVTAINKKQAATPKLNKKAVNAAAKGIAAKVNQAAKDIKAERKTIAATLNHIATSDTEECAYFRTFLNLPKNANKASRKACAAWLEKRYINVCRKAYVYTDSETDAVTVEFSGAEPCNGKGKPYNDMIDAIRDVIKAYEISIARRNNIAAQMWAARAAMREKGLYDADHKNAILTYAIGTPAKLQPQKVHGYFRVSR